jgi:SSS family solute:Na+ symporter
VLNLTSVDWLIMLLYFVFVLGIGFALKRYMKTSKDFFQAGRALPAWICGLAFISANLGAQEVIGMGASGAKYGLETAHFYGIGAIPAMIFVGIFMMPFYYGSKARSVPEFLRMRFDEKTRALNACSFAVMTVFSSGISMYAMARLIQALHVFDGLFHAFGWAHGRHLHLLHRPLRRHCARLHLPRRPHQRHLQRSPPVLPHHCRLSCRWSSSACATSAAGAASKPRSPMPTCTSGRAYAHASTNPMGIEIIGLGMGLGFVLGSGYWCTDFLVIQTAMASKNMESARRVPLIAAVPKMFFPFLVILPGLLAIGLPTPHTTTVVHMARQRGMYRDTNVVPEKAERAAAWFPPKSIPSPASPCSPPAASRCSTTTWPRPTCCCTSSPPAFSASASPRCWPAS